MRTSNWVCGFALLLLSLPAIGAAAGPAHLVADIKPGVDAFDPRFPGASFGSYTAVNGRRIFFTGIDAAAGTTLVQDIVPGPEPSNPQELAAADGTLYFTASDGEHGRELWALPLPR